MPNFSRPLRLDTWELMDGEYAESQERIFKRSFRIQDGAMVFCDADRGSNRIGHLTLAVNWSNRKAPSGVVILSHPDWHADRYIVLAGTPDTSGEFRWRFFCPISRKLVQVVIFDWESQLFVARAAFGRRQRKSDFRRIEQYLVQNFGSNQADDAARAFLRGMDLIRVARLPGQRNFHPSPYGCRTKLCAALRTIRIGWYCGRGRSGCSRSSSVLIARHIGSSTC